MRQGIWKKLIKSFLALMLTFGVVSWQGLVRAEAAAGDVPDHEKTLTVNGDGTYTIALNVKGDSEKQPNYVNVIVVFDTSSSMNTNTGNTVVTYTPTNSTGGTLYGLIDGEYRELTRTNTGTYFNPQYHFWYEGVEYTGQRYTRQEANQSRLQAAEAAVNDLAAALLAYNTQEGNPANTVEMALVDFANMADIVQQPTTSYTAFEGIVNSRDAGNNDRGTNWEAGLTTALDVDFEDDDPTYVIFVSDGNPTFYVNNNGTRGGSGQETTANINTSYNQAVPAAEAIVDAGYEFYTIGIYGNVDRMENLTTASGAPASHYYSAEDTAALQDALAEILAAIEMAGIGNVGITDGTTSNVTTTTGEISHLLDVDDESFKYYRAGGLENGSEKYDSSANGGLGEEWTDAPEATFENGSVVWNINGVLENDVTYTVTFDCWPSQETLDIVADIKNDPSSYDGLDANIKKYIDKDGNLKTNTSANLTYVDTRTGQTGNSEFKNPEPVETTAVKELAVAKEWENDLDAQAAEKITLTVTRDGGDAYTMTLSDPAWKDEVYISVGIMRTHGEEVELLTTGHNFTFKEPKDIGYYWELEVPVVRPMIIDGTETMLILVDEKHPAPAGAKTYTLPEQDGVAGGTYYAQAAETASLTAVNHRRAYLDITKVVDGEDADPEQKFQFTMVVNDALADDPSSTDLNSDNYVWFSVWNGGFVDALVSGGTKEMDNGEWTGYYYAKSGSTIVVELKAGDNLRFLNLPSGTTYTITEGTLPQNYAFTKTELTSGEDSTFKGAQTTTGTIENTNTDYTVTYTNTYGMTDIEITKVWEDDDDHDGFRPSPEEFIEYLVLKADGTDVTDEYADNLTVEVDPDDENKYIIKWTGLDRYEEGEEITYTVEETEIPEYETTGSPAEDHGTITNSHTTEVIDISVEKVWDDADDQDGIRPESVEVQLKADGVEYGDPVTLDETNEWTYTWEGLDKYAAGEEIEYTVEEIETEVITGTDQAGEYAYEVTGSAEEGFTVTNTHTPEVTEATVVKVWDDNENQDGKRPESVTVILKADGTALDEHEYELSEDNEWTVTVDELPKYADGVEIEYTWAEDEEGLPEGYELTRNVTQGTVTTITNSYEPEQTEVTVTKEWDDADNQDGIRPESVDVQLLANGDPFGESVTLDEDNEWTYTWEDLDKYADGEEIEYTVEEVTTTVITGTDGVGTYAISVTGSVEEGFTVTNTHTPEVRDISVTKVWDDADDQDGIRPASVQVQLKANGTNKGAAVTLNEGNNWTYTWEDLDKYADGEEIEYTVSEVTTSVITGTDGAGTYAIAVTGDAATGFTVTNTHTPEVLDISVEKAWSDSNNQDGIRPDSVEVQLLANGEPFGDPVTLDEENEWSYTWEDLDKYADGELIVYTVEETKTDVITGTDGVGTYAISVSGSVEAGFTVTNTHTPELTEATVKKVWDDNDDQDGIRPEELTVTLSDGTVVTLNEENEWSATVENLPKYADGVEIEYTWTEADIEGYELTDESVNGTITTLTNTHEPEEITVSVEKVWDDNDDQDGIRPESVDVQLFADGEEYGEPVTLDEENEWAYTWTELDKYAAGEEIEYTVEEIETDVITGTDGVGTYAYEVTGDHTEGFTVTNTHTPEETTVTVTKVWDDADNQDGIRPTSVQVQLFADGVEEGEPVGLSEANTWTYTWTGLDKYADGEEIEYTVEEIETAVITGTDGPGTYAYEVTGDIEEGFTVTNTHTPELTEATVKKVWDDADNQDGKRPETLTVTLSDGKTVTLSDANGWEATITDLPKYEDGVEIVYTWTEADIEGYELTDTSVKGTVTTLTNSYEPEVKTVSVKKVWDDAEDQDGIRPASLTVALLADGEPVLDDEGNAVTVTLSETNGWTDKVEGLPVYKEGEVGQLIVYTWDEGTIEGYELTGNVESGTLTTLTNSHTPAETEATVKKVWDDADDQDGKRPESLTVTLSDGQTVTLNEENGWTATITGLPKYDKGVEIEYTWTETDIEGYELTDTSVNGTVTTLTNTHVPEEIDLTVTKAWLDENNRDGKRPEKVTYQLYADGVAVEGKKVELTGSNTEDIWTYVFEGLPKYADGKEIVYTIKELNAAGEVVEDKGQLDDYYTATYSDNSLMVANTHVPEVTEIVIIKEWNDNDNNDGFRPEKITVDLLADGTKIRQLELTEENEWRVTVEGLPVYKEGEVGKEIEYTVEEAKVDEYEAEIVLVEGGAAIVIINTHEDVLVEVPVQKEWKVNEEFDVSFENLGITLPEVEVELIADGEPTGKTVKLNEENNWRGKFEELPKYNKGNEIEYTVSEVEVDPGFYSEVSGDATKGYVITNTFTPVKFDPPVIKEIIGDDETTSDEFTFQFEGLDGAPMPLDAEGQVMTITIPVGEEHEFGDVYLTTTGTFTYQITEVNDGKEGYTYDDTVYELVFSIVKDDEGQLVCTLKINGEDADYQNLTASQFTFVNEYREYIDIDVLKVWVEENNDEQVRPESITVNLLANGEIIDSAELSEETEWKYTFEQLPVSDEEYNPIEYAIEEVKVEQYTTEITGSAEEGFVITNTRIVETGDAHDLKFWEALLGASAAGSLLVAAIYLKKEEDE